LILKYGDDVIEAKYFINEIWTENIEDMTTIGLFLLIDSRFKKYEKEIRRYIETHHKAGENYRLKQDEILLVINKNNH